tara:strand:- start:131 stop:607 length:477 start_codon:yes stop_codon:yes gene_type:complete
MKKILTLILISIAMVSLAQKQTSVDLKWYTNMEEAIVESEKNKKPLFLFFTGSDWCGWCIKLQKEVFFKPEFKKWAKENVVLVELDFPKRKTIDENLKKQNRKLAQMLGVRGYPTIWFVNPIREENKINLEKLGTQGYVRGGPKAWISEAERQLNANK